MKAIENSLIRITLFGDFDFDEDIDDELYNSFEAYNLKLIYIRNKAVHPYVELEGKIKDILSWMNIYYSSDEDSNCYEILKFGLLI